MYQLGDWIKIIDKKTKKILAAGQINNRKDCGGTQGFKGIFAADCISFDNRWFFNLLATEHFLIQDNPKHLVKQLKEENIPDFYTKGLWREYNMNIPLDLYREFDINELDPEVVDLVNILNEFDGMKTITSCSGHNEEPLHICILFYEFSTLCFLARIIDSKFKSDFILTTKEQITNNNTDRIILVLETTTIGQEAYQKANKLANILKLIKETI